MQMIFFSDNSSFKGKDVYLKSYDDILVLGDLNSEISDNCLKSFCNINSLETLNRGSICLKNPNNTSCIDSLPTNRH